MALPQVWVKKVLLIFLMVKGELKNILFHVEDFDNDKKEFNFSLKTMCDLIR